MNSGGDHFSSPKAVQWLLSRRQFLLVLMFALLHLRLMPLIPPPYNRVPLLLHFALFLLWQPFINAQSRVSALHLVWIGIGIVIALLDAPSVLLVVWLILLGGIVGGRIFFFSQGGVKWFYLMSLSYLIVMLLFHVLPRIIPGSVANEALLSWLADYGGAMLLVFMVLLPEGSEQGAQREAIDLVYSLFVTLMLSVLVLGSTSLMLLRQIDYIQALITVIFTAAVMLLIASWLWNPVAGFSRLGAIASRYMLSIGLPFEKWLRSLADLAEEEEDPHRFLDRACHSLVEQLPWVVACSWSVGAARSDTRTGIEAGGVKTVFRQGELALTLATQQKLPPVMVWHFNLVTQLVARFYSEKKSSRQLREMAYMQAVHETGARVTHDVKNLLQSLHSLLFVIGSADDEANPKAQPLLRRQLPLITQRLQQTLDKLRAPDDAREEESMTGTRWWRELSARYEGRDISFELHGDPGGKLPSALFTSAAENLLQNALEKRAVEPHIDIVIALDMRGTQPVLSVRDSGSALPDELARDICLRPLASENGLGIGLYQLARLANMAGYALVLSSNLPGKVLFSLRY
ncbi:HAMP domain-containing histidine kinase [Georgfuchsia toluolica]|uniref:HAMP domain-containing histidine kinase n=1 Tax=Georgfuchsia toluolica TaxID=424218 RepID=A0A916J6A4_9PROT|nr:sensor histidine kinase [Georgfuchsia toluolica]CAG4884233.1 HAMP domain-containing histidine kinase [Georgfuchsia toluolica]